MVDVEMVSVLRRKLKSLCCSYGWSFGVFWGFDERNPMLLTLQDAYCEEQMATVFDKMLLQVHMLGEGVIGEVAFTGKHRWLFSDALGGDWNSTDSIGSQDAFQNDSDFHHLFSSGIQTIAVVSVESRGVVQFGSTQKMLESSEFLDQTQKLLWKMEIFDGLIQLENPPSSLNRETDDLNAIFASIILSGNSFSDIFGPAHDGSSRELKGDPSSLADLPWPSTFTSEIDHRIMNSSHHCNQLQVPGREAQVLSSEKANTVYQPVFLPSTSVKNLIASTPCISTRSNEDSFLTSFEQLIPSETVIRDSSNLYSARANVLSHDSRGESRFTSTYNTEGMLDVEKIIPASIGKMMDNQHRVQSSSENKAKIPEMTTNPPGLPGEFKPVDLATDFSNSYKVEEDLSQFFSPSQDNILYRKRNTTYSNLLKPIGSSSVSSGMVHGNVSVHISTKQPSNSVQSSISDAFISGGQEKFAIVHDVQKDLFEGLGLDFGSEQAGECLADYVKPSVAGDHSAISTGMTDCVTGLDVGSTGHPRKGLFSQLGLEEILNGVSSSSSLTRCSFEDQLSSTKRRKMESSNQIPLTKLSCSDGSMGLVKPFNNQEMHNLVHKKDFLLKSQVGLWIDDSYSINAEHSAVAAAKKTEIPLKVNRKRARPGESTRPRPKDRQQIQDRLKELRVIIPNGVKCSIDALLDLTIKHMLFLQSVMKYADKLKEADEPKLIGKEKGEVLEDNLYSHSGSGGATWAFEVGGQTVVCPIIVEDLSPPGQMLIEMLFEDRGIFLEIADIIRGFGLNIWKGVMEIREDKIWARFIVEANQRVTRRDIFWSLVQLQQTSTFGTDSANQPSNAMDVSIPLMPVVMSNQLG